MAKLCVYQYSGDVQSFAKGLGLSRSQLKKFLKSSFLKKSLRHGDEIDLPLNILNYGNINPHFQGKEVKILQETDDFFVLAKPQGIHCHPLSYEESDNCLSFLRQQGLNDYLIVNCDSYDRGLLYRLDQLTSGLLILSKNSDFLEQLKIRRHDIIRKKEYLAIVQGQTPSEGELDHFLYASGYKGFKMIEDARGDQAQLKFKRLRYSQSDNLSLIKVELGIGLRHQIRAQMSLAGFPILGDELYGGQSAARLFLHCFHYQIEWQDKVWDFTAPDAPLFDLFLHLNCDL